MAIVGYVGWKGYSIPIIENPTSIDLTNAAVISKSIVDIYIFSQTSYSLFDAFNPDVQRVHLGFLPIGSGQPKDALVSSSPFTDIISTCNFLGSEDACLIGYEVTNSGGYKDYVLCGLTTSVPGSKPYGLLCTYSDYQYPPPDYYPARHLQPGAPLYMAIVKVDGIFTLYASNTELTMYNSTFVYGFPVFTISDTLDGIRDHMSVSTTPFSTITLECTTGLTFNRGESKTLAFVLRSDSGDIPTTDVTITPVNNYGNNIKISGLNVTISDSCTYRELSIMAQYTGTNYDVVSLPLTIVVSNYNTPYSPGGTTSPGQTGGDGNFGKGEVSDNISNNIPSGSAYGEGNSTGMFTRYLMNPVGLSSIGEWLWSTDLGLNIAQTVISKLYGDPAEALISLMSYPFDIVQLTGVTRQQQNIFWGNYDSHVPGIALESQAGQFDWGEIELKPYWGSFLDYSPHTKVELYLPWSTGFVELDPNQVLPSNPEAGAVGKIRIKTNVDLNKGSCLHIVSNQDNCVIGCFAGQCGMQVPLFSTDYASKAAGIVMGAAGMAIGATVTAGANAAAAEAGYEKWHLAHKNPQAARALGRDSPSAVRQGIQMAKADRSTEFNIGSTISDESSRSLALLRTPGHFARNGGFTDGSAGLGIQYPYIIVSRPQQSVPQGYANHFGFPSNYYGRLGAWGGYTEVGEIHLNGLDATAPELAELEAILKGGIIV